MTTYTNCSRREGGGGGEGGNHSLTELIMMNDSSDKCRKFSPLIHEYFGDVRLF